MANITRQIPGFPNIGASQSTKPLNRLGAMICDMLSPKPSPSSAPRRVEMELQVSPGSDIQIDLQGDVLTIRGAVLTIRGASGGATPERQKYYY